MNLHISAANALIFGLSVLVAYFVYRRTKTPQAGVLPGHTGGDLVGALTAGAATLLLLAFLFGLGDGSSASAEPEPGPAGRSASPTPQR